MKHLNSAVNCWQSGKKHAKILVFLYLIPQGDAICDISPEVKDELRKFRFRKDNANCALICKFMFFFHSLYRILK